MWDELLLASHAVKDSVSRVLRVSVMWCNCRHLQWHCRGMSAGKESAAKARFLPELRETLVFILPCFMSFSFPFTLTPPELLRSVSPCNGWAFVLCGIRRRNGFAHIRHGGVWHAVARLFPTVMHFCVFVCLKE